MGGVVKEGRREDLLANNTTIIKVVKIIKWTIIYNNK